MIKIERGGYYDVYLNERTVRYVRAEKREESDEFDVVIGMSGLENPLRLSCVDEEAASDLMCDLASRFA